MALDSLWGEEFIIPNEKIKVKNINDKIKKQKTRRSTVEKQVKSKAISLTERLEIITKEVYRILGKQKDNVLCIDNKEDFNKYIDKCIQKGVVSIDTETNNSLDPITCKLMGLCLYTPGEKQVYVPVNHRNPDTKVRLDWQLTEEDVAEGLRKLTAAKVFSETHNGKFDYSVLKCTTGQLIRIDWDTLICEKLLDENKNSYVLKDLYIQQVDPEQEKYSIDKLFRDVEYADVDPHVFALYAATDSYMTHRLAEIQIAKFSDPDLANVLQLAREIELPLITVIAEMELAGMEVDQEYAQLLSLKYDEHLREVDLEIEEELNKMKAHIDAWRLSPGANYRPVIGRTKTIDKIQYKYYAGSDNITDPSYWYESKTSRKLSDEEATSIGLAAKEQKSKSEQLTDPINLASPTQLAILFYDILKAPAVDRRSPRATGEAALKEIAKKIDSPICKLIINRRGLVKLITTYINVIPELAKRWPDGRVRTHFNQYGAATGRLSSSDPINFQNIPAHNKEIRMLFKAKEGYKIIGADYSAQEPRLTAFYSQDPNMIKAYKEGRDLYSVIASMSFDKPYEECLEFYPEGTQIVHEGKKIICGHKTHQNKAGKERRNQAKAILLGVLYGRGAASVGEQIKKSRQEAQEIIDKFFNAFPSVKKWIDQSIETAHKKGYVEDVAGRRRRLPDILLDQYSIELVDKSKTGKLFNPFLECDDKIDEASNKLLGKFKDKCSRIRYSREYEKIKAEALKEGIIIHSNTGFIAQAERQAVNSRVQGGAASLTKTALIDIYNDSKLREMGAYLINTVHDEILIEAPDKYMKEAADRLSEIMINSAKKYVYNVPMSCDAYITNAWYLDEFAVVVRSEFKKLIEGDSEKNIAPVDPMIAFEKLAAKRKESTRSQLYELIGKMLPAVPEGVDISYSSLTDLE